MLFITGFLLQWMFVCADIGKYMKKYTPHCIVHHVLEAQNLMLKPQHRDVI